RNLNWIERPKRSPTPLKNALTVYTDAGQKYQRAVATWIQEGQWCHQILPAQPEDSLQTLELAAVVWVFTNWMSTPLNVVTDSLYVAGVVSRIDDAHIKEVKNSRLHDLFR
ncbi:PO113 protein, partial [Turnix velox]|nr:PO113 protein [Turnix velox]